MRGQNGQNQIRFVVEQAARGPALGRPERVALAFVHKRNAEGLRIARLQHIEPDQVLAANVCFRRLRKFCAIVSPPGVHNSMPRIPETAHT